MKTLIELLDEIRETLHSARKDALNIGADSVIDKIDSAVEMLNCLEP